jgi:hypothetical protein
MNLAAFACHRSVWANLKRAFQVSKVVVVVLFLAPSLLAQATSAIRGAVTDPSGASIAGAMVTITDIETNQIRTTTTDEDGLYRVPALRVGVYSLGFTKEGFNSETQTGLKLDVAQELAVNVSLRVGSTSQTVTVSADAPLINTVSSSLGGLVGEEKMANLPLNGRNYIELNMMQAGVTEYRAQTNNGGVAGRYYSSNGASPWSNYYTLDGASMVNGLGGSSGSAAGTTLGVEGIREFKVITTSFSAEYGMAMGSQMVMVSKGGSNNWSGSLFDFLRNSIFDAPNYFDTVQPDGTRLPHLARNNFGASFGGPIKKDKTFFFAVYEGLRQAQGITVQNTIPGQFCHPAVANQSNNFGAGTVIWNGQGNQPAGSTGPCPELGLNPAGAGTNSVALNATVAPLLALYPSAPNLPNNRWTFPTSDPTRVDFGQIRLDHNFSSADTGFIRYTIDDAALDNSTTAAAFPQFRLLSSGRDQFLTFGENHVFNPELLNSARVSYSRLIQGADNEYPLGDLTGPLYSFVAGLPMGTVAVTGISTIGPMGSKPANNSTSTFNISDDVYYSRGRHSFKFGTLINRITYSLYSGSGKQGSLSFTSMANFLLGKPSQYSLVVPPGDTQRDYALNTVGLYAQDDWRATQRLTLNLGLRYEFMYDFHEINNKGYAFRSFATLLPANPTQGPIIVNATKKNFSPRVGFAYDVTGDGKTAIRGAFGVYYDIANYGSLVREHDSGMPPLRLGLSVANPGTLGPLPLPFAGLPIGKSGQGVDYDVLQPYLMQYNLTLERQIPFGIGLSASYVATRGVHLWEKMERNPVLPTSVVNGIPFWTPTATQPANCGNAIVAPLTGFCRLDPNVASFQMLQTVGRSWYDALQLVVTKRPTRGLELQTAFTWSKALDTTQNMSGDSSALSGCGGPTNPLDQTWDKGPSCSDTPYNLRINTLYHFPSSGGDGLLSKVRKGWWMGNIISAQSGYPFTPVLSTNRSLSQVATSQGDRVNLNTAIAAGTGAGTGINFVPYDRDKVITGDPNNWFNPLMFSLGPVGTLGTSGRDILRGPKLFNWDFSIAKDTAVPRINEKANVQFRAEIFNILNHPNFAAPSGVVFSGSTSDVGAYSEAPVGATAANPFGSVGRITSTVTTSRQIQLALKLTF